MHRARALFRGWRRVSEASVFVNLAHLLACDRHNRSMPSKREQGKPRFGSIPLRRRMAVVSAIALAWCLLFELALRIHNPLDLPQRGYRVVLPVNKRLHFQNPKESSKLEREIVVSYNRLGFRGPDPPPEARGIFAIIMMGGSTTHSARQSNGKTWPDHVRNALDAEFSNIWLNNAGMEGHSTFGHREVLEQIVADLHPKLVILLVGINDRALETERQWDAQFRLSEASWFRRLLAQSEVLSTMLVVLRQYRAKSLGLTHWELDVLAQPRFERGRENREATLAEHRNEYIEPYSRRLEELLGICRENEIELVLVTQPALFGDGVDPTTGRELGELSAGETSSSLAGEILDLYNDATRSVADHHGMLLIDLARELPRDSRYFYDWAHFSDEGAEKVGEIVSRHLLAYLRARQDVIHR
jgi:lysophospholipase L1-like esterase